MRFGGTTFRPGPPSEHRMAFLNPVKSKTITLSCLALAGLIAAVILTWGHFRFAAKPESRLERNQIPPSSGFLPAHSADSLLNVQQSWRLYTNTAYGYSFRYPDAYFLYASKGDRSREVIITSYDETNLPPAKLKGAALPGEVKIQITVVAPSDLPENERNLRSWLAEANCGPDCQVQPLNESVGVKVSKIENGHWIAGRSYGAHIIDVTARVVETTNPSVVEAILTTLKQ